MNHKDNYGKLFNTLLTVGTKGNDTLIMAECLKFLSRCIKECEQEEIEQTAE